ncbi:Uncharacterised protein [Mycobacteroides abscessus subsp. bolletii]|uniref:Uncharacterized protein n=1 Tax=Mycobacteroides abscessus subsp. bolletii TaxID=319705 RepID=A0A9Q7WH05_9MYCO|nr:Uncharacterised protein [Mycobacteroides abscessus subsp. abscessus]SHT88518.1 Uncharacterised protein [Mycobacteroides abscessus subsp. bolletii]SHW83281.1 Uncharacterised protein [Mycobacteroides abscessus subsp. bolletii]SIG68511.1 Uncharacterised protein [Mycobacteroides abscessus subsp. abscessus]SKN22159.1 Uncharacterised protein [Mycobacteroides abscessus subsp. bolletii]
MSTDQIGMLFRAADWASTSGEHVIAPLGCSATMYPLGQQVVWSGRQRGPALADGAKINKGAAAITAVTQSFICPPRFGDWCGSSTGI